MHTKHRFLLSLSQWSSALTRELNNDIIRRPQEGRKWLWWCSVQHLVILGLWLNLLSSGWPEHSAVGGTGFPLRLEQFGNFQYLKWTVRFHPNWPWQTSSATTNIRSQVTISSISSLVGKSFFCTNRSLPDRKENGPALIKKQILLCWISERAAELFLGKSCSALTSGKGRGEKKKKAKNGKCFRSIFNNLGQSLWRRREKEEGGCRIVRQHIQKDEVCVPVCDNQLHHLELSRETSSIAKTFWSRDLTFSQLLSWHRCYDSPRLEKK